jgi:hypothetical protein
MGESISAEEWDKMKRYAQHTWKRVNVMVNYTEKDAELLQTEYGIEMDKLLSKLGMTLDQYKALEQRAIASVKDIARKTELEEWRVWGMVRIWENIIDNVGIAKGATPPVVKTIATMWRVDHKDAWTMMVGTIKHLDPEIHERLGVDREQFLKDTEQYRYKMDL